MKTYEIYIRLIRLGIGKEDNPKYLNNILQGRIDWEDFESFAFQQGGTAVVMGKRPNLGHGVILRN